MPCIFDIKPENRDCRFCTATICDERQPKPVETFTTNKIEMYIDSLQEEPVSDDLKEASRNYADKEKFRKEVEKLKSNLVHGACSSQIAMETRCKEEAYNEVLAILDTMQEEPVKRTPANIEAAMQEVEEKSRVFTEAHKGEDADTILAQMRGEEPVSEDLEEASKEWLRPQLDKSYAKYGETKMMELTHFDGYAMLDAIEFGAKWQFERVNEALLSAVLPCFMHGGEADEVVAKLDEVLSQKKKTYE